MPRRSEPTSKVDERSFAVRVRIAIPETGLKCIGVLHSWLREMAPNAHAIHSASRSDQKDCAYIYLNDPALAAECVQVFELEVHGLPKETPS